MRISALTGCWILFALASGCSIEVFEAEREQAQSHDEAIEKKEGEDLRQESGEESGGQSLEKGPESEGESGLRLSVGVRKVCGGDMVIKFNQTNVLRSKGVSFKIYDQNKMPVAESSDSEVAAQLRDEILLERKASFEIPLLPDGEYQILLCDLKDHSICSWPEHLIEPDNTLSKDLVTGPLPAKGILGHLKGVHVEKGKVLPLTQKLLALTEFTKPSTTEEMAGKWSFPRDCEIMVSPLMIDLSGAGLKLSSPAEGQYFDITGTGVKHRISWPTSIDSAFLALDRDGDGNINSVHELFGNNTLGDDNLKAANGFEALRKYDANGDNVIDANDAVFDKLRLWRDANFDAKASGEELRHLSDFGIIKIDLSYSEIMEVDLYGNETRQRSEVETRDGWLGIFDVWFRIDN